MSSHYTHYILYPKWLSFHPDPERHVAGVIERYKNAVSLLGQVDAVIGLDFVDCQSRMIEMVKSHLANFVDHRDQKICFHDFTVDFVTCNIKWIDKEMQSGIAGSPGCVVSSVRL